LIELRISELTHDYDGRAVFGPLDYEFGGRRLAVVGANGTGKSTLMRILAGLLTPSAGSARLVIDDEELKRPAIRDVVGYLSPDTRLYPELSARENLAALCAARGRASNPRPVDAALGEVGLADRADDPVGKLSSGLRQRALVAAAIVHSPSVLLVRDESGPRSRRMKTRMIGANGFARSVMAVAAKDLKCEARSRQAVGALLLFGVTSCVAVSFGLGAWGSKSEIAAVLLWLVIYFSAMSGLGRSFAREEETGTAALLRLSAPPCGVYLGKLIANLALLAVVEIVVVPLCLLLMGTQVRVGLALPATLALGSLGLAAGTTTAAAMVSRSATRSALLAAVSFPILVPILGLCIGATESAISFGRFDSGALRLIASYCGLLMTSSLMLFTYVWED